ncbi:MAG: site-specific integrase, partial [Nitrosopumilaceae archaeon]
MEITLEKINTRNDPYQLFLDSIRNPGTQRRYKNHLYTFLKLIPNQLYIDSLGKTPNDREPETLAKLFVDLARKDTDLASNVIAAYIKEDS